MTQIQTKRPTRADMLRRALNRFNWSKRGRSLTRREEHQLREVTIRETPPEEVERRWEIAREIIRVTT